MDRNVKPNPFAAFDNVTLKPKSDGTSGASQPLGAAPLNAFNSFSPSAGGASTIRSTQIRPGNLDAFGFPVTPVKPAKANPFDGFASQPNIQSRPATEVNSFSPTPNFGAAPVSIPMDTKGGVKPNAFDTFPPSKPASIVTAMRSTPEADPFASMTNSPTFSSPPMKPQRYAIAAPAVIAATEAPPAPVAMQKAAYNPFGDDIQPKITTPTVSTSATAFAAPPVKTFAQSSQQQPRASIQQSIPVSVPLLPPQQPTHARVFGQSTIAAPASILAPPPPSKLLAPPPLKPMPPPRSLHTKATAVVPVDEFGKLNNSFGDSKPFAASSVHSNPFSSSPVVEKSRSQPQIQPAAPVSLKPNDSNPFPSQIREQVVLESSANVAPPATTNGYFGEMAKAISNSNPFSSSSVKDTFPVVPVLSEANKALAAPVSPTPSSVYNQAAQPLAIYRGVKIEKARKKREPIDGSNRRKDQSAVWTKPYFADLFTKSYFDDDDVDKSQSIGGIRESIRTVRDSLFRMVTDKDSFLETRYSAMVSKSLELFDSASEIFEKFPSRSGNCEQFHTFIDFFMQRVRGMSAGK
jgi:hypothetical protein